MTSVGPIQYRLIGQFLVEWSKLEAALDDLIWRILGLSDDDGRVITTKFDARTRIEVLIVLGQRYFEGWRLRFLVAALDATDNLREHRNFIAHGVWGRMSGGVAVAMSLKPKSELGEIIGQSYPHDQMRELTMDVLKAKRIITRTTLSLGASPGKYDTQGQ
ncbi:hypothetical protein HYPDE_32948 [Hyphomicrobium denitrificans 1NES1]|uniref:Uncharacterized protein n=1 Tax=Hyphomicrobium denitrificans 1NES1 TaxID=670307 RepID=N0B7L3_9HYPH|nr:hypothetical protein [Hyphomicrobium denitrificans]AGK58262.1 hypothetical protein HYPDE_32948 [Hyphomicrobium denitrificans 1NES1]